MKPEIRLGGVVQFCSNASGIDMFWGGPLGVQVLFSFLSQGMRDFCCFLSTSTAHMTKNLTLKNTKPRGLSCRHSTGFCVFLLPSLHENNIHLFADVSHDLRQLFSIRGFVKVTVSARQTS